MISPSRCQQILFCFRNLAFLLHQPGLTEIPSPPAQRGGGGFRHPNRWELSSDRERGIFQETLKQLPVNMLEKEMPVKTSLPELLHRTVCQELLESES